MKRIFKKLFLSICGLLLSQLSYADSNYTIYDSNEVDGIYYKFNSSSGTASVSCKYKVMKKFLEEFSDTEDTWEEERTVWISSYNDCTGNIVIPSTVTYKGVTYNVTSIGDRAFSGCTGLTSISLPESVTEIGDSAFAGCSSLTSFQIPASVTRIERAAFKGCSGLKTLVFENGNNNLNLSFSRWIEDTSWSSEDVYTPLFEDCPLQSIYLGRNISYSYSYNVYHYLVSETYTGNISPDSNDYVFSPFGGGKKSLTQLIIGEGVTSICERLFIGCSGLTSLTLPSSLATIGNGAFFSCSNLTTVNVIVNAGSVSSSQTSSGGSAFSNVSTVNVKMSDISAISSNRNIYSFLPVSATWNYYLNDNLLTTLDIPSSITSIGDYAFYNAKGITSLTLPSSLTSIGNYAFNGCTPTAFICKATTPPTLGTNNNFGGTKKIYVPYKSMTAYKSAWSQLSTPSYTYLPLLDVMFFETQSAASYASELTNKDKSKITSVAFYEGGLDNDLTESEMKSGMNPNCLYYVPASAGLSGDNIITLDTYLAESVTLTDNYAYDCPIPFHTEEIKYVHNPSVWANGSAGWETLSLPFKPETFEASERGFISPIMLGSKGNFWLRKFVGASSDAVYFASTIDGQMEANTPYLVAFPGKSMGNGHLEGQTITFTGYDANIQVTEQPTVKNNAFVFVGNYDIEADGIEGWVLNTAGNSFVKTNTVGNQPFRAYFRNDENGDSPSRLRISFNDPTDIRSLELSDDGFSIYPEGNGELVINSDNNRTVNVYALDGRIMRCVHLVAGENHISGLQAGVYIINNQKLVIR